MSEIEYSSSIKLNEFLNLFFVLGIIDLVLLQAKEISVYFICLDWLVSTSIKVTADFLLYIYTQKDIFILHNFLQLLMVNWSHFKDNGDVLKVS